jgi:hypothetical protein
MTDRTAVPVALCCPPWLMSVVGPSSTSGGNRYCAAVGRQADIRRAHHFGSFRGRSPMRVTRDRLIFLGAKKLRPVVVLGSSCTCDAGPRARGIAMGCIGIALRSILKAMQSPQDSADAPCPALSRRISRCANSPPPGSAARTRAPLRCPSMSGRM